MTTPKLKRGLAWRQKKAAARRASEMKAINDQISAIKLRNMQRDIAAFEKWLNPQPSSNIIMRVGKWIRNNN